MKKDKEELRAMKLEVADIQPPEMRKELYRLSELAQHASNRVWRLWEKWHTDNDSTAKLREFFAAKDTWSPAQRTPEEKDALLALRKARAAYRKLPKDEKIDEAKAIVARFKKAFDAVDSRPKLGFEAFPTSLSNDIYHDLMRSFPALHCRVIVLLLQTIRGNIVGKKSAGSKLKWWTAILLDRDGRGRCLHPQPLPFDAANTKILPCDEKGRVRLETRLDRIARPGKKTATSTPSSITLRTDGRAAKRAYSRPAVEMAEGTRELKGSKLFYDWRKRKWFVALSYVPEPRKKPKLDPNETAIIRPGRRCCWLVRFRGLTHRVLGRGHHIRHKRRSLLMQRLGRQHSYRLRPARKGRGRKRALEPSFKLTLAWNGFTNAMNQSAVEWFVEWLTHRGVGHVVYFAGDASRCLANAGKLDEHDDGTGWPWHQFEKLFERKCGRDGIRVEKTQVSRRARRPQTRKGKEVA